MPSVTGTPLEGQRNAISSFEVWHLVFEAGDLKFDIGRAPLSHLEDRPHSICTMLRGYANSFDKAICRLAPDPRDYSVSNDRNKWSENTGNVCTCPGQTTDRVGFPVDEKSGNRRRRLLQY